MNDSTYLNDFYNRNSTIGASPRTQQLDYYEGFFRCLEYEGRVNDFWGRTLAAGGKPQFRPQQYDTTEEQSFTSLPLEHRRPPAPSRLARTIITRFTEALFSDDKRPQLRVLGDPLSEEYLEGIVRAGRLWAKMVEARNLGGAIGSVVVSFAFHDGKPVFEIHNAKNVVPTWKDRATNELECIDITYQYSKQIKTRKGWDDRWFWYRRFIGTELDVVFEPAPVLPDMADHIWVPANVVAHALGDCPVVWFQNTLDSSCIDGEPDVYGQHEAIKHVDALYGMASIGTIPNCDPTTVIKTNKKVGEIKKGSQNALVLLPGEEASYMELGGTGATVAMSVGDKLKEQVLEAVCCVLEGKDAGVDAATATAIRHRYRSFFGRVSLFRQQYGEGLRVLGEKVLAAARTLTTARMEPVPEEPQRAETTFDREQRAGLIPGLPTEEVEGPEEDMLVRPVKYRLDVPMKIVDGDGDPNTPDTMEPRVLGGGGIVEVVWPEHITPTPAETGAMVATLTAAEAAGYLDSETAGKLLGQFMGLSDIAAILRKAAKEKADRTKLAQAALDAQMEVSKAMGGFGGEPPDGGEEDEPDSLPGQGGDFDKKGDGE